MDIIDLDPGKSAPADSDCISIDRLANGRYTLTGSILTDEESVAMVGGPEYETMDAARAEGVAWATGNAVKLLYVATSGA